MKWRWHVTVLAAGVLLVAVGSRLESGFAASEVERLSGEPTANQLLDAMASIYASCRTYQDSGIVETAFIRSNVVSHETKLPFRTSFVRPDRFRFEYQERCSSTIYTASHYIVWAHGDDVRTWWNLEPGVERPKSLRLALAGATGISGGSANTVPTLLLPDTRDAHWLSRMRSVERISDSSINGSACYRLSGLFGKSQVTVWLDRTSLLILRLDHTRDFEKDAHVDAFQARTVTTYRPMINETVDKQLLDFAVP